VYKMKNIDRVARRKGLGICLVISICSLVVLYGCGQKQNGGGGSTTNYTISGKLVGVSAGAVRATDVLPVTHIVAIGATGARYLADYSSAEGTFSLGVNKGCPYVVGFYNRSGGQITLLGYLKQDQLGWDSLPIIEPTVDATDLGTVEVFPASLEATPSVNLNSLISQMNMDLDVAQYYGQIDDPLSVLTNLDVDGNGEFDFTESVGYLFEAKIGMGPGPGPATGQIGNMLNGSYNHGFRPKPQCFVLLFAAARGASVPPGGSTATLNFPCLVYNGSSQFQSSTASVEGMSGGGWTAAFDGDSVPSVLITSPEVLPSGTYTIQVSGGWNSGRPYTFMNVQGTQVVKVGATDKIIFPALNLVTSPAGYITTVNYKWLMLENGAVRDATLAELKAVIADTQAGENALVETSPAVGFMTGPNTLGGMKKMPLTGSSGSVDVSEFNVKATQADLNHIAVGYNLTSRVICDFRFTW
jgi:hypothetical protein